MGEVETNTQYNSSTAKRPSPSTVAEVLGIVELQQQPSTLTAPPPNRKTFNNPLPAIGKSSNEALIANSQRDPFSKREQFPARGEAPRGLSRSFPSPRSVEKDVSENGKSHRNETILHTPRGGKRLSGNSQLQGSLHNQQGRKDCTQLPPLTSASCDNSNLPGNLSRSKTTLTRTHSDSEELQRPRSNSNPRPKSARGIRTRSFHGEESHKRIMSQTPSNFSPLIGRTGGTGANSKATVEQHVLLTQRRSGGHGAVGSKDTNHTSVREAENRTQLRPANPSPNESDSEDTLERPSAPSPPSPGLDSDSESDREFDEYIANLHGGNNRR